MNDFWNRPVWPVTREPFDHVCVDDLLPKDLYDELAATFPECPPASGPTGFTIHAGDEAFDALMANRPAWRSLWQACDSPGFTRFVLAQFSESFANDAVVDLSGARHVLYRETREQKQSRHPIRNHLAPDDLWVRFDLMQGRVGYSRAVHVDHRRRAATMLLYFSESETSGTDGGDLRLHGSDGSIVTVAPRANRAVFFPCNNQSWHSVSPIVRQDHPRNFLQITLSSAADLWEPLPMKLSTRLKETLRSLVGAR